MADLERQLDPRSGQRVGVRLEIAESDPGSFMLGLSAHRQAVNADLLARILD